jgi:hypothetical protein
MTLEKAIKKYKLERCSETLAKQKSFELNVDDVLYMNVQKNKYAYIVKNGPKLYLYHDEKSIYTKMYKGLTMEEITD